MLLMIWSVALLAALVLYLRQVYTKLSKAGIHHLPGIPLFGNFYKVFFKREHFSEYVRNTYEAFPDDRFVGSYMFLNAFILIRDLELLKKVGIKDFDYFVNRRSIFDEENEPVFGRNLLSLKGEEWKDMRSALSPAFTSSKIRLMVPFMVEVGDQMIDTLKKKIKTSGDGYLDVESRDITTRYANDVIATCGFGLKVNSQAEDNQFYIVCKDFTTFSFWSLLKMFGYLLSPTLMKKLKVTLITEKVKNFFVDMVLGSMKYREDNHIIRNDLIHLLMEAKKGRLVHDDIVTKDGDAGFATVEESDVGKKHNNRKWTDIDLVAQAVIFLIAGFDTVSTVMAFLLHELALNPDVQEKLAREIRDTHAASGGKLDYNSIQNMTYLDMVVSEILRRWPPAAATDRLCVKDYNLGKPHKNAKDDYIVRAGDSIQIPIWALHMDPKYYPDPEKFDPERFSEENKHKINPFTYMPFGVGPRNCIGSRFALCEVKVMLYQLLLHIEMSPCKKTCVPTKLGGDGFAMRIKGGHWVRIKVRE